VASARGRFAGAPRLPTFPELAPCAVLAAFRGGAAADTPSSPERRSAGLRSADSATEDLWTRTGTRTTATQTRQSVASRKGDVNKNGALVTTPLSVHVEDAPLARAGRGGAERPTGACLAAAAAAVLRPSARGSLAARTLLFIHSTYHPCSLERPQRRAGRPRHGGALRRSSGYGDGGGGLARLLSLARGIAYSHSAGSLSRVPRARAARAMRPGGGRSVVRGRGGGGVASRRPGCR
jgi:hypothetical protein